jgi:DNA modification methylase
MTPSGEFAFELREAKALVPYARNARTHTPEQVDQLAASLRTFRWTNPVLIDEADGIVAGHGRVLAAAKLYAKGERIKTVGGGELPAGMVPVIVARGWSEAEKRAYVIADNKLAMNAGWDESLLKIELAEIKALEFDLAPIGFSDIELGDILRGAMTDPEDAPEAPAEPVSRLGDVWLLGGHRLACGDSTSAESVALALAGAKPHLMVTDAPYGVNYDASWRNKLARTREGMGNRAIGAGDVGKVLNDSQSDWREAWARFGGDVAYVWHADLHANSVFDSLVASGFEMRAQIIWAKNHLVIGRGDYHFRHEPCWYAVRKGATAHWQGDRTQTTLWEIPKPQKSETGHSTQKPIECMKRPIENNSKPGEAVYDPFSGSGTTIIAAEMTGRTCLAIELSPAYVDVSVLRWQAFTGRQATLEATGESFAAVAASRAGVAQAANDPQPHGRHA